MDPGILAALAMWAVPMLGLGGALGVRARLVKRKMLRTAETWKAFAETRGLDFDLRFVGGGAQARTIGAAGEHTLTVATLWLGAGLTTLRVLLHPPLDIGLDGSPDLGWGSRSDRAQDLFQGDVLRAAARLSGYRWTLTDDCLALNLPYATEDLKALGTCIDALVALADEIVVRARTALEPHPELRHAAESWRRLAAENGFDFGTTPLHMQGVVDGCRVAAFSRFLDDENVGLGAEARFAKPLRGALGLAPTAPSALLRAMGVEAKHPGSEDWTVGEPAFDAAFVVQARDASRLGDLLPPSLRARLLLLNERTPLYLDDVALRIAAPSLPAAAAVPEIIRDLAGIAAEIEARVHPVKSSVYR